MPNYKAIAERRHASRRARERYDLRYNRHDRHDIVQQIQTGRAKFVERQSGRVSVFDITHQGVSARVVYDKHRKEIVTFLPESVLA